MISKRSRKCSIVACLAIIASASGCFSKSTEDMRPQISASESKSGTDAVNEDEWGIVVVAEDAEVAATHDTTKIDTEQPEPEPVPVPDLVVNDEPEPVKVKDKRAEVKSVQKHVDEAQDDIAEIKMYLQVEQTVIDIDAVLNDDPDPIPNP